MRQFKTFLVLSSGLNFIDVHVSSHMFVVTLLP